MNKILIIGSVASGKTTQAKKLSKKIKIPHYELDCIVWNKTSEGRVKRTPKEQVEYINKIDKGCWIIEGTYRESCHCLFELAEKIIFFDTPLYIRKYRILIRYIKQKLGIEPCHYHSDIKMLKAMYKWTNDFEVNRTQFLQMLSQYNNKLTIIKKGEIGDIL